MGLVKNLRVSLSENALLNSREENHAFGIYYSANQAIKYPGKRAGAIGAIDQDAQIFACVIR